MLTRKQADNILNLYISCKLTFIDYLNVTDGDHALLERRLRKHKMACLKFNNYVNNLVKKGDKVCKKSKLTSD